MFKDDALVAFTDALLENQAMEMTEELHDLEGVVRRLQQTIQPTRPPDSAFRSRLTQRLNDEWTRVEREQRVRRLQTQRTLRYVASAAAVVLMVTAALLLANPKVLGTVGDSGGGQNWLALVVAVLITTGFMVAFYLWNTKRRR